jgi:phosphate transport system substrate-binding protein
VTLRSWLAIALLVNAWAPCAPAAATELAAYSISGPVSGELRIWASPADGALIQELAHGFEALQPGVHVDVTLHGPESTMAGLYTGVADLAFLARELRRPVESMAFEWVHQYKPFEVQVANAGLNTQRPGSQLAAFVAKSNPLTRLTLAQLDAILGAEHRRGSRNLREWGQLGLGREWQGRPIHVYGPGVDSIAALFVRATVLQDSYKWNPDYRELPAAAIDRTLAHDPLGIAYGAVSEAGPHIKSLALAAADGDPFTAPTAQTIAARTYPLTRVITVVLDREPGRPVEPKVKEFLHYVLSREGQAAIALDGAYVPLSPESAQQQLQRLE